MARTWTIRPAVADDLPELRDLFTAVFGIERPLTHVHWKFAENPAGAAIGMVAVDAGRIVGQYMLLPVALRIGGEVVAGGYRLDSMVRANYRGRGVFVACAEACHEAARRRGIEVMYGFPNVNSYPSVTGRLGWTHTGNISRWVRHLDPSSHPRVPRLARPLARLAARLLRSGDPGAGGVEVRPGRPDDRDMGRLIDAWRRRPGLCRIERSAAWYAWRFSERSGARYEWLAAWRGGEALATMVVNIPDGVIADFLGEDPAALEALTATAVRLATKAGCPTLATHTNEPSSIAALRACGFFARADTALTVHALVDRRYGADIYAHANWSINPADFDTV